MHEDSISEGENILLVDDLLATGGTMKAAVSLVERTGGNISKIMFLIELKSLEGRKNFEKYNTDSVLTY